jgi:hypothetical protein
MLKTESRLEHILLAFLREPMLWPVLVAIVGHAIALLVPVILLAVRDQRVTSGALLLLLLGLSASLLWRETRLQGRPSPLSGLIWATWSLSAGAAWVADHYGIF